MVPPNAILFISDLHLSPQAPELQELFLQFLRDPAKGAKQLYILGDLFDQWIGEDIFPEHQLEIAMALKHLAEQGTEIFFLGGNRDFLLSKRYLKKAHCKKLPDPSVIDLHGKPTLLTHGDSLCTSDIVYQRYRKIAQHPITRFLVRNLPNFIRQKLANKLRAKSKDHQQTQTLEILDVTPAAVVTMMQQHNVRQLIHGHVHRPKIHQEPVFDQSGRRFVLGDWHPNQASFLICTADGIILATYSPLEGIKQIQQDPAAI